MSDPEFNFSDSYILFILSFRLRLRSYRFDSTAC
jgi:hypothetical protein